MQRKIFLTVLLLSFHAVIAFSQKTIRNNVFHYSVTIPDSLLESTEPGNDSEITYYDDVMGVVMMITGREGIFDSTQGYINCSKQSLEHELKDYQGDSTLKLISCSKSTYLKETIILHFDTKALPAGFNRCIIFFVHDGDKELQFSFMYDKADNSASLTYVDKIMRTLKLY